MAKLLYASNMSLDGWTEDERGAFDCAPPDDEVFEFITKLMRSAGTYLYAHLGSSRSTDCWLPRAGQNDGCVPRSAEIARGRVTA